MALKPIVELVQDRLPWLTQADEPLIESALAEQYTALQEWTGLDDIACEVEGSYTKLQRLLLVQLVAYQLVVTRALQTVGSGKGNRVLKKTKADVVEAEFETVKAKDGVNIALDTDALLAEIRRTACGYARQLGYALSLCPQPAGAPLPFVTLTDVSVLPDAGLYAPYLGSGCYAPGLSPYADPYQQ